MKRYDLWRLSARNLCASPVRSALTVLGMAIGVGAILAVLTLGTAGKHSVEYEMSRLGVDRVWLTAGENGDIQRGDAAMLSGALGMAVTEQVYAPATVRRAGVERQAVLVGCSRDYLAVMDTEVLEGRGLYALEWRAQSRAVLMGEELARSLRAFPGGEVSVSGFVFRLAGVVRQRNELSQIDAANAVFVPINAFCDLMGDRVHELTITVPREQKPQAVAAMAEDMMRQKRGADVETMTMQVQIEAANGVVAIFVDVLKWVALICILVGGIGVMNILLVSVRERRREIGVMQSLGSTRAQICWMFLLEALMYALVGGALGLVIGFMLIGSAGAAIGLSPIISVSDCALTFGCAVAVGLFFGVLPASRASRMRPVDALRDD